MNAPNELVHLACKLEFYFFKLIQIINEPWSSTILTRFELEARLVWLELHPYLWGISTPFGLVKIRLIKSCSGSSFIKLSPTNRCWTIYLVFHPCIQNFRNQIDLLRLFQLDGSMIIVAENIMGSVKIDENGEPILQYGYRCYIYNHLSLLFQEYYHSKYYAQNCVHFLVGVEDVSYGMSK